MVNEGETGKCDEATGYVLFLNSKKYVKSIFIKKQTNKKSESRIAFGAQRRTQANFVAGMPVYWDFCVREG